MNAVSKPDVYILQTSLASYREVLKDIKRKQIFNLVVDTNPTYISNFFRAVSFSFMNIDAVPHNIKLISIIMSYIKYMNFTDPAVTNE